MAGTKAGGLKAAQTNRAKYGKEFYSTIGRKAVRWAIRAVSPLTPRSHVLLAQRVAVFLVVGQQKRPLTNNLLRQK